MIDPLAQELSDVDRQIAMLREEIAQAKRRKSEIRARIKEAVGNAIMNESGVTNVELASRFGFKSETSVRTIRNSIESGTGINDQC